MIQYVDSLQVDDLVHVLLEYADNGSLFHYLHPWKGIPERLAVRYLYQIASAVQYLLSKKLLHRDIKPENILVDRNFDVKLCDFGWACVLDSERPEFGLCGTLEYMSPEMLAQKRHEAKTDVWALGILLFELLHGSPPYKADNFETMKRQSEVRIIQANPRVSAETRDLLEKMVVKDPKNRFSIDQVLAHPAISTHISEFKSPVAREDLIVLESNFKIHTGNPHENLHKLIADRTPSKPFEPNSQSLSNGSQKVPPNYPFNSEIELASKLPQQSISNSKNETPSVPYRQPSRSLMDQQRPLRTDQAFLFENPSPHPLSVQLTQITNSNSISSQEPLSRHMTASLNREVFKDFSYSSGIPPNFITQSNPSFSQEYFNPYQQMDFQSNYSALGGASKGPRGAMGAFQGSFLKKSRNSSDFPWQSFSANNSPVPQKLGNSNGALLKAEPQAQMTALGRL